MAKIPDISAIDVRGLEVDTSTPKFGGAGLAGDTAADALKSFSTDLGSTYGDAAKGVQTAGDEIAEAQDKVASAAAESTFLQKKAELDQQSLTDPDYATLPGRYSAQLKSALRESSAGIADAGRQADFEKSMGRVINFAQEDASRLAYRRGIEAHRGALFQRLDANTALAANESNPASSIALIQASRKDIQASADAGYITQEEAETLRQRATAQVAAGRYAARIATDPQSVVDDLSPQGEGDQTFPQNGTLADFLQPQKRAELLLSAKNQIKTQQLAAEVQQERQFRLQQQAQEQASKADEAKAISDLTGPDAGNITAQQIGDPNGPYKNLTPSARLTMLDLAKRSSVGSTDATLGPGFMPLLKRVYADQSDPTRITDAKDLVPYINSTDQPPITVAGFTRLQSELGHAGKPDTQAENAMKSAFLANARAQITGSNELGLRDPKGDTLYLQFLGHFFDAYDKAKSSGKTPGQLLSPDSADYLGKSIGQFKRPMSQWASDMLAGNATAGHVDFSTKDGIVAAYHSGAITRDQAADALRKGGFLDNGPQVPLAH